MLLIKKSFFFLLPAIFFSSFLLTAQTTTLQYKEYRIERKQANADSSMTRLLLPYSDSLNRAMNKVIGFSTRGLEIKYPESTLGNFSADAMRIMAEKKFGKKVDAAFINADGLRSYVPKGDVTLGKIYELMPFDNLIVLQELRGSVLQSFLNKIAERNGWPLSGLTMGIKDGKAVNVMISGEPLNENTIYVIANSDYIANGGSGCDMLKPFPQISSAYLFRDALIEYVSMMTKQAKPIDAKLENRVVHVN